MESLMASKMDALVNANKIAHASDTPRDDSSSVTSRSSSSTSGKCTICGGNESPVSQPFVECPACNRKRDHATCLGIDSRNLPKDWKCRKCTKEDTITNTNPFLTIPPGLRSNVPTRVPSVGILPKGKVCEEIGCTTAVLRLDSVLCYTHGVEQRYKKATTVKPVPLPQPSSLSKIKKKKLYNFKVTDELKDLKRKRPIEEKRSSLNKIEIPAGIFSIGRPSVPRERPSSVEIGSSLVSSPTPMRTPEQRGAQFNVLAEKGSVQNVKTSSSLRSPAIVESPNSPTDEGFGQALSIPCSARRIPRTNNTSTTGSPDHSPPPPWHPAAEADANRTPGDAFTKEDRETQKQKDTEAIVESQSAKVVETSKQEPCRVAIIPPLALQRLEHDEEAPSEVNLEDTAAKLLIPKLPESLEALRNDKASAFDTSELDSYLSKQAEPDSDIQLTSQELLATQIWGHINPTVVWRKELSEEWLAEKQREITARGGRKENFGKLLTPQVRKERAELGWNIHQNSEFDSDPKWAKTARYLEELFRVQNIDEWIPGSQEGQLVMMEPSLDEYGKKRKKQKVYPI